MSSKNARYLLITHVPVFAGQSAGVYRFTAPFLADLRACALALSQVGIDLTVATPLREILDAKTVATHPIVDVNIQEAGFAYKPLPAYRTMTQYMRVRTSLGKAIKELSGKADIVQLGYGGHPVSLGQLAWPIVGRTNAKRIWLFDANDPFTTMQQYADSGRNPAKRIAKQLLHKGLLTFCKKATQDASLVISHHPTVLDRFGAGLGSQSHYFPYSGLSHDALVDNKLLNAREKRLKDVKQTLRFAIFLSQKRNSSTDHILLAFAKAKRLSANISLDVIGPTTEDARLVELLAEQKIDLSVRYHGPLAIGTDLRAVLDQCDVMLCGPDSTDSQLWSALSRGLPVVGLSGAIISGSILKEKAGILVARGEVEILAQAIIDLSRNRSQWVDWMNHANAMAMRASLSGVHALRAELVRDCLRIERK